MSVVEEHLDVLQNIEATIVYLYRERPDTTDYAVVRVLEALGECYVSEKLDRPPRPQPLSDSEGRLYEKLHAICEWRLGRAAIEPDGTTCVNTPTSPDELIQCLKKIIKSAAKWTKRGGRQGYLDFVDRFVP